MVQSDWLNGQNMLFLKYFSTQNLRFLCSSWRNLIGNKLQFYHTHLYQKGEQYVNVKSMFSSVVVLLLIVR